MEKNKQKYHFSYRVHGVRTLLPLYIVLEDVYLTDEEAFSKAVEMAKKKWPNREVTFYIN